MDMEFDKIVKLVAEKSDITIDQARKAVMVLLDQLKEKMPEFASTLKERHPDFEQQLEKVLKGTPLAGLTR